MISGHTLVMEALQRSVPPVTLLKGPESIGKRTIAEHLVRWYKPVDCDVMRITRLDMQSAREVHDFATTSPFGTIKFILIDLDGATEAAQNSMLKLLEDPPAGVRFLMYASRPVLPTIESRAIVFRMGLLSNVVVAQILTDIGFSADAAKKAAAVSGGRVSQALSSMDYEASKIAVINVINSLATQDSELFDASILRWGSEEHRLLSTWLIEAMSNSWVVFSEEESNGLHLNRALMGRLLKVLSSDSRPRLAMKTATQTLIGD